MTNSEAVSLLMNNQYYKQGYTQGVSDVLDKIRAKIADLDDVDYDYEGYYKAVTDALKIIDKYKAESEG